MRNVKKYGLGGVSDDLELGRDGIHIKNDSGVLAARNAAGSAYVPVAGADPTADNEFVTKRYFETHASLTVTCQINGGAPGTPTAGQIGIVTTAGGAYTLNAIYRGVNSAWVAIALFDGMIVSIADALTGGTKEYTANHLYVYDEDTNAWNDIGVTPSVSGVVKSLRANVVFGTSSPLNIGAALPSNARTLDFFIVVTEAFNGTSPTLTLGDAVDPDRLAETVESNLAVVGAYAGACPYLYGSATQLQAVLVAGSSTAGAAAIEITYSLV